MRGDIRGGKLVSEKERESRYANSRVASHREPCLGGLKGWEKDNKICRLESLRKQY